MKRKLHLTRLEDRVTPATAIWDGGGTTANNRWLTPANWVGDVAPQPGDDLVFGEAPFPFVNANNDFAPGTVFRSITITGEYRLFGNAIALTDGIVSTNRDFDSIGVNIGMDITLAASQTFANTAGYGFGIGRVNLNGHVLTVTVDGGHPGTGQFPPTPAVISIGGSITGGGGIIKDGPGRLLLYGDNSFIGPIHHRFGYLTFASNNAGGAAGPDNLTLVEAGAVLGIGPDISFDTVHLSIPETITFAPRVPGNAHQLNVNSNTIATFTGPLTLTGTSRWLGNITVASGLFGFGSLDVQGRLTFPAGVTSPYSGTINAETGSLLFNGVGPFGLVTANDSQSVSGNGSVGPLTVQGQTRLAPGNDGIGTLTTGNLIAGGFFDVQISPTGNDKVFVNGTATIGGRLTLIGPLAGFIPSPGSVFRIIDNDGTDPIAGVFDDLPPGAAAGEFGVGGTTVTLFINYRGGDGNDVELTTVRPPPIPGPRPFYSVGAGAGGGPQVNVYNADGDLVRSFLAYEASFTGGVHVATADMNGDGIRDVITAPGFGGGPVVRIWDGSTGALINQYHAYDASFRGGVFIATGRINADSIPEIITGAGQFGGPHVKVFHGATATLLSEFLAYDPIFTGGVRVGAIDYSDLSGSFEPGKVVTGAGPGGGPHVRTFSGLSGAPIASFFAYEPTFTGGVFVAAGKISGGVVNPDDNDTIVVSPGAGRSAEVRVFDFVGVPSFSFLAYDAAFQGGATVAFRQGFDFGVLGVITGAGPGGGPHVKDFGVVPGERGFFAFDPSFTGGVFVG